MDKLEKLKKDIHALRSELEKLVVSNCSETSRIIELSQKLDKLIVEYHMKK